MFERLKLKTIVETTGSSVEIAEQTLALYFEQSCLDQREGIVERGV